MKNKTITVKKYYLEGISLSTYEVVDGLKKPLIFSFHGFDGYRDGDYYKREDYLARMGYFVVGFDSVMHGERKVDYFINKTFSEKMKSILHVVYKTANEASLLFNKYFSNYKNIYKDSYDVIGYSMGGMTAFYLATIDPKVKNIVSFVSSPSMKAYYLDKAEVFKWEKDFDFNRNLSFYETIDPLLNYKKLDNKNIFMAVGKKDDVVLPKYCEELYEKLTTSVFKEYPTGHEGSKEMFDDAYIFLHEKREELKY